MLEKIRLCCAATTEEGTSALSDLARSRPGLNHDCCVQYVLEGVTAVLQGGAVALLAAALLKGLNTMPDAPPEARWTLKTLKYAA